MDFEPFPGQQTEKDGAPALLVAMVLKDARRLSHRSGRSAFIVAMRFWPDAGRALVDIWLFPTEQRLEELDLAI